MKRFYMFHTYRIRDRRWSNSKGGPPWPAVSLGKCVCFQVRAATEGRPYSCALEDLTFEDLLSPDEKAEKQQLSKTGRLQALDRFVHNGGAPGGAHRPLLHSLYPQSHYLSN